MMRVENGNRSTRILILHGWMHSSERYKKLAHEIDDSAVDLYEFPGFGETKRKIRTHILEDYTKELKKHLETNKYDMIIAHSMGGNVLLRVLNQSEQLICDKVMLINPAYSGIPKLIPLTIIFPFILLLFKAQQILPVWLVRIPVKLISLFTINEWKHIDDLIVKDARRSDAITAAILIWELAFDRYRIEPLKSCKKVWLVKSQYDRIISAKKLKLLKKDLGNCVCSVYSDIGHTPVLECFDKLVSDINGYRSNS